VFGVLTGLSLVPYLAAYYLPSHPYDLFITVQSLLAILLIILTAIVHIRKLGLKEPLRVIW